MYSFGVQVALVSFITDWAVDPPIYEYEKWF